MTFVYVFAFWTAVFIPQSSYAEESLPSFIKPCKLKDPSFKACVTKEAQRLLPIMAKGVPSLEIQPYDPLALGEYAVEFEGMNFILKDPKLFGISKAKIQNLDTLTYSTYSIDFKKNRVVLSVIGDFKMDSKCTMDSSKMPALMAMGGEMDCTSFLNDAKLDLHMKMKLEKNSKGVQHLVTYDLESEQTFGKSRFSLGNGADKSNAGMQVIEQALNERADEILKKLSPPMAKRVAGQINKVINKLNSKIPFDKLFEQ